MYKPSLNDVIIGHFGENRDHSNPHVHLALDGNMPNIYTHDQLYKGIKLRRLPDRLSFDHVILLMLENFVRHAKDPKRITTRVEGESQHVYFDNGGQPIPPDKIAYINDTITQMLEGQELDLKGDGRFSPHGTQQAARCLREMNGSLVYETLTEDDYSVRARITLPNAKHT